MVGTLSVTIFSFNNQILLEHFLSSWPDPSRKEGWAWSTHTQLLLYYVHLLANANSPILQQRITRPGLTAYGTQTRSRGSLTVQLNIRVDKTPDLSDFECGVTVGVICGGFSIWEMAILLVVSPHTALSTVYWGRYTDKKKKTDPFNGHVCSKKVNMGGRKRMAGVTIANRKVNSGKK